MNTNRNTRSEYTANISLVEKHKAVECATWMTPSPKRNRTKPSVVTRLLRFLGV